MGQQKLPVFIGRERGFQIFSRFIPYYGFFIALGTVFAGLVGWLFCKRFRLDVNDFLILLGTSSLGALIGAKLLYFMVNFPRIDLSRFFELKYLSDFMRGGFVFYGGFLGGSVAYFWAQKKFVATDYSSLIATLIPLGHGFGRIGCHFAGCCHGKECQYFPYIIYQHSFFAPNGVPLFPVQLVEAAGNFLIFFILLYFLLVRGREKARNSERYLILYSTLRFVLEFFRGDSQRGKYWIFSTSQWISLLLLVCVIPYVILKRRKNT